MSVETLLPLTDHARLRMDGRRIPAAAVAAVLDYGRVVWVRGAQVYALGRKEVDRAARRGLDLRAYAGLQVVCTPDGDVITVYRNHDFRGLRRTA